MHKLLSSLLCCVSESKHDPTRVVSHHGTGVDTKSPSSTSKSGAATNTRGANQKVGAAAAAQAAIQKETEQKRAASAKAAAASAAAGGASHSVKKNSDRDSTSVNETDTITNDDSAALGEEPVKDGIGAADADRDADHHHHHNHHHHDSSRTVASGAGTHTTGAVATAATNTNTGTTAAVAAATVATAGAATTSASGDHYDANGTATDGYVDCEMEELDPDYQPSEEEEFLDLTKLQPGQAFNPTTGALLGPKPPQFANRKCLILDLDETLVHSSFKYLRTADFVIPVEIDNQVHHVYVIKRPGVDEFLRRVGELYEVVVFTASVSKYGDPLLDKLDVHHAVHHRLFRDSCYNYQGNFIKNLSQVGRPLRDTIIIDNSPASYIFHPQHSIPISSWFSDTHDNELLDLLPILEDLAKPGVDDVGMVLDITI
ncbi:hypothetical protein DIURU_000335 [Diutina rugosa]|uniref:FCP1 homology domain-containing protein n=1 Tax=Diutina rugosa TaxID=5481 RepID=A0A642UYR5_DIURU|nr:uncharacterized protein DIURU_000335 [Diutina rugosa]KAA8907925.1 hypothetical protein DIURU_000335 [Diutina rugosa]